MSVLLLIEPDYELGQTTHDYLKHSGHKTKWCRSAQQAIAAADKQKPDLIILELQLPIHNGIEFLYELRSYQDWQNVPVIIYSQVPPNLKAISPMLWDNLKVTAYLYKPQVKLANLVESIDNALSPVT